MAKFCNFTVGSIKLPNLSFAKVAKSTIIWLKLPILAMAVWNSIPQSMLLWIYQYWILLGTTLFRYGCLKVKWTVASLPSSTSHQKLPFPPIVIYTTLTHCFVAIWVKLQFWSQFSKSCFSQYKSCQIWLYQKLVKFCNFWAT